MKRSVLLGAVTLGVLALGACGARPAGEATSDDASTDVCTSPAGQTIRADLDGDGNNETVVYGAAQKGCPAGLSAAVGKAGAFARTGSLVPTAMRAVTVPGRQGQILVVSESHPRGGHQDHLFAYADGKLAELTADGHPVLPFVATDTPSTMADAFTAVCLQNGIGVQRAVTHQPIGIAPAFDIEQTSYTIDGTTLTRTGTEKVKDNVLDHDLATQVPGLAQREVLVQGCG